MARNKAVRRGNRVTASSAKGGGKTEAAKISRSCHVPIYQLSDCRYADLDRAVCLDSSTSD